MRQTQREKGKQIERDRETERQTQTFKERMSRSYMTWRDKHRHLKKECHVPT